MLILSDYSGTCDMPLYDIEHIRWFVWMTQHIFHTVDSHPVDQYGWFCKPCHMGVLGFHPKRFSSSIRQPGGNEGKASRRATWWAQARDSCRWNLHFRNASLTRKISACCGAQTLCYAPVVAERYTDVPHTMSSHYCIFSYYSLFSSSALSLSTSTLTVASLSSSILAKQSMEIPSLHSYIHLVFS